MKEQKTALETNRRKSQEDELQAAKDAQENFGSRRIEYQDEQCKMVRSRSEQTNANEENGHIVCELFFFDRDPVFFLNFLDD